MSETLRVSLHGPWFWRLLVWFGLVEYNAHGYPEVDSRRWQHGHFGCTDGGDLGPCDCLCHRVSSVLGGRET